MRPLGELLAALERADVRLQVEGDRLIVDAPPSAVDEVLRSELVARKAEIVATLRERSADAAVGGAAVLSSGQRRLLALAASRPDGAGWHVGTAFRVDGPLDADRLDRALDVVVARHDALRTRFPVVAGGQRTAEVLPVLHAPARRVDATAEFAGLDDDTRAERVGTLLGAEIRAPFDLSGQPPWRTLLVRIDARCHALAFTMHHLVFDGASKRVFLRELAEVYRAIGAGDAPRLPARVASYASFTRWQQAREAEAVQGGGLDYWRRKFAGSPSALDLPADPSQPTGRGGACWSRTLRWPPSLLAAVRALGRREGSSDYMVLLASFCAWLARQTGQEDLIVCAPLAGRDRADFEDVIGYCNTVVALRIDAAGNPTFAELVARTRTTLLEAWQHRHVPLQALAELPDLRRVALARALFAYQDAPGRRFELSGSRVEPLDLRGGVPDVDFSIQLEPTDDGGLAGVVELRSERFDAAAADRFVDGWRRLAAAVTADPARRLLSLPGAPGEDEVENWLNAHPKIARAALVRRAGHAGAVAYLQFDRHDPPTHAEIESALAAAFPRARRPTALVVVERIPRTAAGHPDLAALPPPPVARGSGARPRTELERLLVPIWQRVLWLDEPPGIDDDFIGLGGHSLLSAQLVVDVERALDRPIPDAAIAGLSTIAAMARAIEDAPAAVERAESMSDAILRRQRTYVASWTGARITDGGLVVGLGTRGPRLPLFWCLQGHPELVQLARYLGADRPVWGMRSDLDVMERTDENLAHLARRYADELVAILPEGPFVLGGNCAAAHVALSVARELRRRGRDVGLLFLHENFLAEPYDGRVALLFGAQSDRNPLAYYAEPWVGWRKYYTGTLTLDIVEGAHGEFFVEPNVQVLVSAIRRRMDELERGSPPADALPARSGMQILPPEATKAKLTIRSLTPAGDGRRLDVVVDVTNASPIGWTAGATSGIALVNRWLEVDQRPLVLRDARLVLPAKLAPGETVTLTLATTVPPVERDCLLMIDLVDEGVTEFWRAGSSPCAMVIRATG